jgi:ribokinase
VHAPSILALGSINFDLQVRAESWPTQSKTLIAGDFLPSSGGKASNVAFLARKLGAPAVLIGQVGQDAFADCALAGPRAVGVDTTRVRCAPGQATGVAMIVVEQHGDKTIVLAPNANGVWPDGAPQELNALVRSAAQGSVLVLDLEVPGALVVAAARAARERGLRVLLDPSPAEQMRNELYGLVDYLTPNPSEAKRLTGVEVDGEQTALNAGRKLRERGVTCACMKLRDGGCVLVEADGHFSVPALHVQVVDKTGAGDAFAGALAVALLERKMPREAVRFAVAASSLAVTGYGSQASYPDRERLELALAEGARGA